MLTGCKPIKLGKTELWQNEQDRICYCLNPHYATDATISQEASDSMKIIDQVLACVPGKIIAS